MAPQDLASKERSLFAQIVKFYENKQFKKGLKAADQILRKKPDHGDTIAMKALIINSQGNTDEAFSLAKIALQKSMKSHICWHVYGLLYRHTKNYEEAIKAYKFALKLEPDSAQIQKDLALLQMQMRDYAGYVQSRRSILQNKTMWRQNWTALAVAQHLAGDLWQAERTLATFEETLRNPPPRSDIEHTEAVLYKNTIIAEMGDTERALEHLESVEKNNADRGWVMEKQAEYLLKLGRFSEAETAYCALLERNVEYRSYFDGLMAAKKADKSDIQAVKTFFGEWTKKFPRADAPRRIPLDLLVGEEFRNAVDEYLQQMLRKGVPSTFANLKALYASSAKRDTIQALVKQYNEGRGLLEANGSAHEENKNEANELPVSVQFYLAQHYNYQLSRDLEKAMQHIEDVIKLKPDSVDYHQIKARIWKNYGNFKKAADTMEYARTLDTRDRYINTKAAKYKLRNNENNAALDIMSKFTRNDAAGGPLGDLHDMQCQWFMFEDGMSYMRQQKFGLALKRFHSISSTFDTWHEDQFDFHSFSLRKGQIRAYIDMIRWEDHLREHPFFTRAAIAASQIYVKLHDRPELADASLMNGVNGDAMDASERKKARKKAKKEQEKAAQAEAERKDAKKAPALDQDGQPKKEDKDPNGDQLLHTSDPLGEAMKFVESMMTFSPRNLEVLQTAFEVLHRRNKVLPALQCLLTAHNLAPSDPVTHFQLMTLRHHVTNDPSSLPPKALDVFETELSNIVSKDADLTKLNDDFLQAHHTSAHHVQTALKIRASILDPKTKTKGSEDLIRTLALEDSTLRDATRGLDILKDLEAGQKYIDDYVAAAHARYPEANVFEQAE